MKKIFLFKPINKNKPFKHLRDLGRIEAYAICES